MERSSWSIFNLDIQSNGDGKEDTSVNVRFKQKVDGPQQVAWSARDDPNRKRAGEPALMQSCWCRKTLEP
jgi:hypothetical protein